MMARLKLWSAGVPPAFVRPEHVEGRSPVELTTELIRIPRLTVAAVLCALMTVCVGCGSGGADEEAVLASLTDLVIVPGYTQLAEESRDLSSALAAVCSGLDEDSLSNARQSWRDMGRVWMRSQSTWFGPVMDRRTVGLVGWPEVEPDRIEALLSDRPGLSEDDVRYTLSSSQRGLGAVEYLIFGDDALRQLSSDSNRCDYLVKLGRVIEDEVAAVLNEWTVKREEGEGSYSGYFTGRASSSLITKQAVAELVRTQVFLVRTIVDMRLASALGLRESGQDLSAIPGGLGHNSLADLRNQVLGIRDMYEGHDSEEGMGISDIVRGQSKQTDERMRDHFAAAMAAIDAVEGPLIEAILERPEQVRAVYDRLDELQVTLNTEVVSQLAVAVGFSDTDGDSLR